MTFEHKYRVTYADCTLGNHVYYGRYLDLLEAARGAFFHEIGCSFLDLQEQDYIFPVLEARIRYKAPARYDDVLAIEVWPTAVERVRLNFAHRITIQAGKLIAVADTFHVCTGMNERPKPLPQRLTDAMLPRIRQPLDS